MKQLNRKPAAWQRFTPVFSPPAPPKWQPGREKAQKKPEQAVKYEAYSNPCPCGSNVSQLSSNPFKKNKPQPSKELLSYQASGYCHENK
ncbi:MAG: hypothetical protein M2R45_03995 [Verrucomicrobia subdivision 3 bacterium]|nr:hypothetical protein [Limisphaerales bacterium]MCS1415485.1 hypothetical protein [Limisphaerales bacterium]